ncbi:MAG TPA: sulfotransferase [Gemmatimonadota bacterium]|nr:sulfotransferase [Gemmatimonadota bacterium]
MTRFLSILRTYAHTPSHVPRNLAWRLSRTTSRSRTIFVVGSPRSGTSLVQSVLAAHSRLFSIPGETGLFTYQNIFARRHFGLSWEENQALFRESRDVVDFFDRAVRLLESRSEGRTFVEKTPQHVLRLEFLNRRFPNARFVHVLRDGRDCFASAKSHAGIPQAVSARRFAGYWRRCVDVPLRLHGNPRLATIRYEDFARDAPWELDRMMRFLELESEDQQLDPERFGSHKRGRRDEFRLLRSPVSDRRVGRWQTELSSAEQRDFERVAHRQLAAYGYLD